LKNHQGKRTTSTCKSERAE